MAALPPEELDVPGLVQAGITAYRAGDRRRARQLLTAATQRDPRHELAWLWLSAAHDDAAFKRICLEKVLALNPQNPNARRGLQLLDGGAPRPVSVFSTPEAPLPGPAGPAAPVARPPAATMRGRPAPVLTPSCPWCQAEFTRPLADRCPRCGRRLEFDCPECERGVSVNLEACAQCGRIFGKFHAEREPYLARLLEAYRAKGWVDQALLVNDYLLELAPAAARYHLAAAQLYDQIGDTTRSVNAYRRLLDLEPGQAEALTQLARWYLTLHQTPELKDLSQRLRALKPRTARLTLLLGDIDYELDDVKSAERTYRELLRRPELDAATRARLHLRLGEINLERGRPAPALRDYEASLAAGVDTEDTQAARRRLDSLRPPLPRRALASYGETGRAMLGPVLLVWLLAALQVGFQVARLNLAGLLGLVLAVLGSYLLAAAQVTPLTPEWRELLGEAGLAQPVPKALATVIGGGLVAAALVLVLAGM
ncbi:MAG: hypothetical protein JNK29_08565 [Anaerolineales bacterium]|nr:hypothetical protein [Anaerolineales bacterium]